MLFGVAFGEEDWSKERCGAGVPFDPGERLHALVTDEPLELIVRREAGRWRWVVIVSIRLVITTGLRWCGLILCDGRERRATLRRLGLARGRGVFGCGRLKPFGS